MKDKQTICHHGFVNDHGYISCQWCGIEKGGTCSSGEVIDTPSGHMPLEIKNDTSKNPYIFTAYKSKPIVKISQVDFDIDKYDLSQRLADNEPES